MKLCINCYFKNKSTKAVRMGCKASTSDWCPNFVFDFSENDIIPPIWAKEIPPDARITVLYGDLEKLIRKCNKYKRSLTNEFPKYAHSEYPESIKALAVKVIDGKELT